MKIWIENELYDLKDFKKEELEKEFYIQDIEVENEIIYKIILNIIKKKEGVITIEELLEIEKILNDLGEIELLILKKLQEIKEDKNIEELIKMIEDIEIYQIENITEDDKIAINFDPIKILAKYITYDPEYYGIPDNIPIQFLDINYIEWHLENVENWEYAGENLFFRERIPL